MAEKEKKIRIPGKELGSTGLKQNSGIVYEEELRKLQSYSVRHRIFKQMAENDPVIGAVLYAIELFVRSAEWFVQPASDKPEDEENKTFLEEVMNDMSSSWEDTIAEIFNGLFVHGFSYHELVYKLRNGANKSPSLHSKLNDGKVGWRKIAIRDQESLSRWIFDKEGGLDGMEQLAPPDFKLVAIPIEKALLFRTSIRKGNPEGISLLRKAYRAWYFKEKIETYEAIGVERNLAGMHVIYVPAEWADESAADGEKAAFEDIKDVAVNVKRDEQEGMVFPSLYDEFGNQLLKIELIKSEGKHSSNANEIINRYDQRIAMTMLAQFLLLGSDSVGSFALSSSHTELFANAVGVLLDTVASVFNRHAIPRLFELNGKSLESLPKFVPGDIEKPDLAKLGEFVSKLSGAGITFSDPDTQNFLREAASFPPAPEEEELPDDEINIRAKEAEEEETLVEGVKGMRDDLKKAIIEDKD